MRGGVRARAGHRNVTRGIVRSRRAVGDGGRGANLVTIRWQVPHVLSTLFGVLRAAVKPEIKNTRIIVRERVLGAPCVCLLIDLKDKHKFNVSKKRESLLRNA